MKTALYLGSALAVVLTVGATLGTPQDTVTPPDGRHVHVQRMTPQGTLVQFAATASSLRSPTIIRTPEPQPNWHRVVPPDIIHLEGSVEITTFARDLSLHDSSRHELWVKDMVLTADEADYNPETGEIRPQGHVSVKFLKR